MPFAAILQNELVLYTVIVAIVGSLLIARFVGVKNFAGWMLGKNTPAKRASKRTAD